MSQINNITGNTPVQRVVNNPILKQLPTEAQAQLSAADRLELTGSSYLLAALKTNDVRTDLVSQIRQQIDAGTYDADGSKLDAAADRLLDELNR